MADNGNSANPILSFLLGAAIVAAVAFGALAYTGNLPWSQQDDGPSVTIELPDVSVDKNG